MERPRPISFLSGILAALLFQLCLPDYCKLDYMVVHSFALANEIAVMKDDNLLPDTSPTSSPQPFIPLLAPSPMGTPFFHNSTPKLSGRCTLNFSAVDSLLSTTAVDCWTSFAPFLANVICCPQFQATLIILIGQSSKETGLLALDSIHANYCLSDIQQILGSQGANSELQGICMVHSYNLSKGSCPINDINGFESVVDSSKLLAACGKVDAVNECCSQICQNAILEAARKLAMRDGGLIESMAINNTLIEHSSKIDSCRSIVLRWLSSRLDTSSAKQVLRRLSNCNVNGVCPLDFPDTKSVAKDCGNVIKNNTACCHAMENYVSHLQKQSFITNLQALGCASLLGMKLQKMNVSSNVYSLCQITLKDFSLQVGTQESGCLLPSLPSDATFDPYSGISFTCDLNDNIAAPWPSASQTSSSTCNKSVNYPALPAATSSQLGLISTDMELRVVFYLSLLLVMLL
ncbi:GPI-anchored protein [Canna indica]|uniref:GPI-anchored protein n=1 Tax=Canna indica TaxID=4628 RepID=A0AAQ3QFP4_9LILI|nr:GPI-anchored protein [Canna indica]